MIDFQAPLLHVGSLEIDGRAMKRLRSIAHVDGTAGRIVERNARQARCVEEWRIGEDVLFKRAVQSGVVEDAVAATNRGPLLAERIPCEAETRREIAVGLTRDLRAER